MNFYRNITIIAWVLRLFIKQLYFMSRKH